MGLVQRLIQPLVAPLVARGAFNKWIQPKIIQQRLREAAVLERAGEIFPISTGVRETVELLNKRLLQDESPLFDYVQVRETPHRALRVYRDKAGNPVAVSSWRQGLFGKDRERLLMVADHRRAPGWVEKAWFDLQDGQTAPPQWRIRRKASLTNAWAQLRGRPGAPGWGFQALPFDHLQSEMLGNVRAIAARAVPRIDPPTTPPN